MGYTPPPIPGDHRSKLYESHSRMKLSDTLLLFGIILAAIGFGIAFYLL